MLEGKELEGKIGEYGSYEVDVTATGKVKAMVGLEVDLIAELRKLAAKTDNKLDDKAVDWIAELISSKPEDAA